MNQTLLDELIALYIIGELSTQELELIEQEIPEETQKDWLDTVNMLAYGAPPVVPSQGLKAKVWQKLGLESADFLPQRFENLAWKPHPVVKGIDLALLYTDSLRREASYLVRCKPGVSYPAHKHHDLEKILILDGEIEIGGEVYGRGDFLVSRPNSIHAPNVPRGCLFYVHTSLDDRFVEWAPSMVWQLLTHRWGC